MEFWPGLNGGGALAKVIVGGGGRKRERNSCMFLGKQYSAKEVSVCKSSQDGDGIVARFGGSGVWPGK